MSHSAVALKEATGEASALATDRPTPAVATDEAHQIVAALHLPVEPRALGDARLAVAEVLQTGISQDKLLQALERILSPLLLYLP